MPIQDGKRIIVDTSTDPDTGVAIADIQRLVPVTISRTVNGSTERRSSSDLGVLCGGQVGDTVPDNQGGQAWQITSRIDINMWAKFKPVRYNAKKTTEQLDESKLYTTREWLPDNSNYFTSTRRPWWEADDGNYGINMDGGKVDGVSTSTGTSPTSSNPGTKSGMELALIELVTMVDGKLNGWSYNPPRGRAVANVHDEEPYRDIDFNRYNHQASKPVNIVNMDDVTASDKSDFVIALDPQEPAFDEPIWNRDFITPHDLKWHDAGGQFEKRTLHMGFAIFKGNDPIAWVTDEDAWAGWGIDPSDSLSNGITSRGQDGDVTCVGVKFVDRGEYKVLPFYSTEPLRQHKKNYSRLPQLSSTRLFTVPYTDFVTFFTYQAKTIQNIAWGYPSSHKTNRYLKYVSDFYLDSNGDYYIGSQTAFTVNVVITRLTWEAYWNNGSPINPSSNGDVRFVRSFNQASLPDETLRDIGSCEDEDNVYLDFGETWHVYIQIAGEVIKSHQIKTMPSDEAPV